MKYGLLLLACLFTACSSGGSTPYSYPLGESAAPEWRHGQDLSLTGTLWPSSAGTKFYIKTIDGKSAHLKGRGIDHLKPGTKIALRGRVEYENSYGTAGASNVAHNQTFFYVNVSDYRVIGEAAWDVEFQNAVDPDKPDFSLR